MHRHLSMSTSRTLWRPGLPLALAAALLLLGFGLVAANSPTELTRVTESSDSDNRASQHPSLSADGGTLAFSSDSDFDDEGNPAGEFEIWLYDTATGAKTRITGAVGDNRDSQYPDVNADGTVLAFSSDSNDFGDTIPDNQFHIWLYNVVTPTLTRITKAVGNGRDSEYPSLSSDGTKVAFQSDSDLLAEGRPDNLVEIWLYDTNSMAFTRVTSASHSNRDSRNPSLSGDGTKVAFESDSDFLGQGIPPGQFEIWVYDTATMTVTRITDGSGYRHSNHPSINADGTKLAFSSDANFPGNIIPPEQNEIWLYDTSTMAFTRVTTSSGYRDSKYPSLSADGNRIAFESDADFLGQGISYEQYEVWLYDTGTRTVTRVTTSSAGSDRGSGHASLNGDGEILAFYSDSAFPGHTVVEDQYEIWLLEYLPLLTVTKSLDNELPEPGQSITYTIMVTNSGLGKATGTVVSDTLDEAIDSMGPVTLEGSSGTVAQDEGDLPVLASGLTVAAGGSVTLTLPVTVANANTGVGFGTIIPNVAAVTSSEVVTPVIDSVTATVQFPHLSVLKTVDDIAPEPGQDITYTIIVNNSGNADATGTVVSDTLDDRIEFVGPVTLEGSSGTVAQVEGDLPELASGLIIPAGGSVTLTLPVMVATGVVSGAVIPNVAVVTSSEVIAPVEDSVGATAQFACLSVSKTVDDKAPEPGQRITYTVSVINSGHADATGGTISDILDPSLTLVNDSVVLDPPEAGTISEKASELPTLVSALTVEAGKHVVLTFQVDVSPETKPETVINNEVDVTCEQLGTPVSAKESLLVSQSEPEPYASYLPVVLKADVEWTKLSVFNSTTGLLLHYTVHGTPQGDVGCINIPAGATQFCGSFEPGTYSASVSTEECGAVSGQATYQAGTVTRVIRCN